MNSLMPNLDDALLVHSQAHEEASAELHAVALKLLAICGQTHIATDGLDAEDEGSMLDGLPGALCLDAEAAAVVDAPFGKGWDVTVVAGSKEISGAIGSKLPANSGVVTEGYFKHKQRAPAYELWLLRKADADSVQPECPFTVGDYVQVGWPRKHGAYRFPVVAQRVAENFKMLQVHKDGDRVSIFGKDGQKVRGMASVIDVFVSMDWPETAIFECIYADNKIELFDVLMLDGIDCTKLPFAERRELIATNAERDPKLAAVAMASVMQRIETQDDLHKLDRGQWIVRYESEVLADLVKPFWFMLDAGVVKPGTVLPWVKPSGSVQDSSGLISVVDTGLPTLQIHKMHSGVRLFVSEGGRNRAANLPQVVAMASQFPEDCIVECQWTCSDNGVPVSVERVQNHKNDLATCDVRLHPYDLVYWGDDDLSGKPMYERVEMLESIVEQLGDERVTLACDSDVPCWYFVADSVRPMDGSTGHCFAG